MVALILVKLFGSIWSLKKSCQNNKIPLVKQVLILVYKYINYNNGSMIAWNSYFKGEPCLPHGTLGIFISGDSIIGDNCVIFQQVTIGSNMLPDSKSMGAPKIGDNCYIGSGAKIIGNIVIGNNVRIGANSVVYKNVPDNSIVVSGEQTTITRDKPLDNKFYTFNKKWVYFENGKWNTLYDKDKLHLFKQAYHN